MKHLTFILSLIVLINGCGLLPTEEEETVPRLSFFPEELSLGVGTSGVFTLQVKDFEDSTFAISLRMTYDTTVVSFSESTGFTAGDYYGSNIITFVKEESSMIHLTITMTQGQAAVVGSGDLGVLTFTGRSVGSCDVGILSSDLHFYDADGHEVTIPDLEIESATVTVQ